MMVAGHKTGPVIMVCVLVALLCGKHGFAQSAPAHVAVNGAAQDQPRHGPPNLGPPNLGPPNVGPPNVGPPNVGPPNLVLIIADDQAWNDYSFAGHSVVRTPNIDRLAAESLMYDRAYVPFSLCRPSLATIMTGLFPHQHRVCGNDPAIPAALSGLPRGQVYLHADYLPLRESLISRLDAVPKLSSLLGQAGYMTLQTGKWWEGSFQRGGFTHGMTHGDPAKGGRHGDAGLTIGREGLAPVESFLKEAQAKSQPFFIYYAPFLPHAPHNPPERILAYYKDKTPHLPLAKYWANCEWADACVGDLLHLLDATGQRENTLVVYLADNGWINRPDKEDFAPRSKRSPYEGGIRTPLLLHWPGQIVPRLDERHLASSIDILPSVLAALGQPVPDGLPGVNLLDNAAVSGREAVFGELYQHDAPLSGPSGHGLLFRYVICGEYKLIVPHLAVIPPAAAEFLLPWLKPNERRAWLNDRERRHRPQLYHLTTDPQEQKNLAESQPQIVTELRAKLDAWWQPE